MRCKEALGCWQQELLGQPVDPAKLEEAYAHIAACQELCARTLSAAPDFDLLSTPEQRSGQTDLYEALGLAAEEEGDAHARQWARLSRRGGTGKAAQEAIDYQRAMALAAWQAAANYYQDGLRIRETAFLRQGMKRVKRKRLEPAASARGPTKTDPRTSAPLRKAPAPLPGAATPGEAAPGLPQEAWPLLTLVSHVSTHHVSVEQRPPGWQTRALRSAAPLVLRDAPVPYQASTPEAQEPKGVAAWKQPQIDGRLAPFELALSASAVSMLWELDVLVRAQSPRHPWSSVMLTLEEAARHLSRPVLMEFSRGDPQMTGWRARFTEIPTGAYQLRFSANDARGQASEDAALELRLAAED
jgi:hypothetical protein